MPTTATVKHSEPPRLGYTVATTAKAFGLSRPTIYKLIAEGKLHSVKVNGLRIVTRQSIDELLGGADATA